MNERPISELRPIYLLYRDSAIMDITKVFKKEESRFKVEECLEIFITNVDAFQTVFERMVKVGFSSCWDVVGELIQWEKYTQILVESKKKVDSSHENIATMKGKIMVNSLKRYF